MGLSAVIFHISFVGCSRCGLSALVCMGCRSWYVWVIGHDRYGLWAAVCLSWDKLHYCSRGLYISVYTYRSMTLSLGCMPRYLWVFSLICMGCRP